MSNVNTDGLPIEMQQRIAEIIAKAQSQAPQQQQPQPDKRPMPVIPPKQPSLMDHTIMLRQEVAQLSQQMQAQGQVVEAVGQAVGQLYQMFCQQTETTDYSPTYQTQEQDVNDY